MSTVVASSADICSALMCTPHWTSFEEACKHNSDMKSWNNDLKTLAEKTLKSHEGGEGLSIHSLKPLTEYALHSNKEIVGALSTFKEEIMKEKGANKKMTEENEEIVDVLGDQYIKMSSHMMDFLSEMEYFLMLARNSHEYVARVIQQYLETETDKRDAEHYRLILEKLEELKRSDNIFEHSAESLLEKAVGLKKQYEELLKKLTDEIDKLAKKVESAQSNWMNITSKILICAMFGIIIVGIAVAVLLDPPIAIVFAAFAIPAAGSAGAFGFFMLKTVDKQIIDSTNKREIEKSRSKETRVTITELGNIKSSIVSVIIALESLLYKPDSAMDHKHKEDIDFTMKNIEDKLNKFLNRINELEEDVETCKKDTRKARKDVYT